MKTDFYSLTTDGSNNTGIEKMNLSIVRLLDVNINSVDTPFLDTCCTAFRTSSTTAATFHKIDSVMTRPQLS